jgi:hypothetical protein
MIIGPNCTTLAGLPIRVHQNVRALTRALADDQLAIGRVGGVTTIDGVRITMAARDPVFSSPSST